MQQFTAVLGIFWWFGSLIKIVILWSYLYRTCDEIRPTYKFDVSCQGTVPEAITAFLEGQNFEDVIRTAVTLGGDCDTLTCISGSIAEAFYGVPDNLKEECRKRVTPEMLEVIDKFDEIRKRNNLLGWYKLH